MKISELREIGATAAVIPLYRVLGFEEDFELLELSEAISEQIEKEIGKALKKNKAGIEYQIAKIKDPYQKEFDEGGQEDDINKRLGEELSKNEDLKTLSFEQRKLWGKEIEYEFTPIEIPKLDYSKLFSREAKRVSYQGADFELDGYIRLLDLRRKGIVKLK